MSGKLKDLYVKRNQNQYQPAADSWEARAAELSNMSGGAMQQGETAGNGAFGWLKDSFDAGVAGVFGGTARLAGEFMPFGNDTLNSWADYFDDVARRNSPQPGQNLEGIDYVASAVGNALGSGAASALEAGAVAGLGSLLGAGGVAGTVLGGASKVIPGVGKAVQAGKTLWGSPMGKYLVANVAGSPFEAASESGNLISDMRKENQQGTANYTDDEIRDAALRSGALNLAWLTGMNMLEAGTLGKITGALGGKMAKDTYKGIAGRALMGGTASGIGEGAEEYGQNLIGDYSKRGSTADFNYDEAMEAAKMGAIGGGVLGGLGSGLSAKFSKKNSDVAEEIASEDGGTIEEAPTEENFWENKEAAKHSIQQAYADGLISKDDARVMLMKLNDEELGEADKKRLKAREKQVAAAIESRRIQGYNDELDNYVNNYESGKEAFINAIGGQESGGDYGAVNGRTGASGKYQIMPENWPAWAEEAGIGADAEMTPENQEIVARYKLGEYYDKYGARGAAIAWYAGEGALDYSEEALNRKQGNGDEPSINEYADSVLARMGNVADNARIDDSEENYFNESDSMGLPKLSAPTAKGFDVSHLVDEEAQDARELFGKKQDENIGKQNLGNDFFSNIKVEQDKRAKAIKDIARAVSQPNTFDELRNSIPSNYLEQMQKARAVVPVNNNAVGRPIPSQTGTALTMQRGRNGGLNTDELSIMQKYQGNPDAFNRQFKKSVEAVRDAVNRGDITPDVGRAYMQNLGNMYNTVAGTVQNDSVILQGQDPAIIKMLGNLRDKRRRGDTGALPSLLQENGNADRSAAFANRNNPLAPLNLPVRTQKEWDKAEAEYKARTEEKSEKHTRQQTIADIVNARAAQKWDEAETEYVSSEKGIDITLPKGVTTKAEYVTNKKTGKKEVALKFSGEKISDEFKKKLRAHGFNWNVGRKAWVAEENIITKTVAEKLTQKDNGEVKNGKEQAERINKAEEARRAEKRNAGETASAESIQTEAKQPAESNQDEVNKKAPALAEGYTTESGRSLDEADENEFILHKGEKNFGEITQAVANTTDGALKAAPIRLQVGNAEFGLKHLLKHEAQMQSKGFNDVYKFIDHVLKNFNQVYSQQTEKKPNRFVLYCKDDKSKGFMPIDLELKKDTDGYYTIVSAMPHKAKIKGTLVYDGSSRPSTATTDSLLSSDTNGKGGDDAEIVLAKPNVPLSTQSVAQPAENVKKINLPKGTTVDVSIVGDIVRVKFNGEQGKGTGGIMGRAGYKWKSDKQVWQARKTEKAMDVAEQLGYTEEAKPQERDYELERDELWDTFATKLGIDNILSVDKANEELKGVEGLHDGAIVYYDNNNRLYHIISKESDPEMLKLGYNYDVSTFDVHHMPISAGAVKTADEVIKRVTGLSKQKVEPKTKAKPSADTFSKTPDALVKGDKISSMPLSAMKFIKDMFDKGEARQNAKDAIRIALFKSKDLEASARNNTYDNFKIAYFDAAENYLADNVDNNPAYAKLLESGNFAKENMERAAKETYNLFRVGMEKQAESKPAEKQETKEPAARFDGERARKSLDALIGRKKKNEPQKNDVVPKSKFMNVFNEDELDAEIEKLKKELSKLSANPFFNPTLMKSAFKVGGIYLQKGVNRFTEWAGSVVSVAGEQVRPFLPAVWDALKKYPDNQKFNDDVMTAVMEYVGEGVDNGKSLSAIKREFADDYGDEYLGYVDAAFEGVKKYPTSDNFENVVESKQDNTEGGSENGNDETRSGGVSENKQPEPVRAAESSGETGRVSGQSDEQHERPVQRPENEPAEKRPSTRGSNGAGSVSAYSGQGENSTGAAGRGTVPLTPAQKADAKPSETPGHNYTVTKDSLGDGGVKTKYKNNVEAIKLLKQLEAEGRQATPAEQEILANYVGWGGLSPVFNINYKGEAMDSSWTKEAKELKELLTDEEYKAARASTTTAFYTPVSVIKNIYGALERLGFKGGKILEPSMGTGNFFGVMPESMRSKSSLNGVELDPLTGRIAKQLYQKANVEITGFEKAKFPDNYFDLAISNVPFGSFRLDDAKYNKYNLNIHNYFFAKAMDKVRPGGLVCFVTSTDTMQGRGDSAKLRALLKGKADLVGAIRLPDTTFKANANTEVTSDVIILQKRKDGAAPSKFTQDWLKTVPSGVKDNYSNDLAINEYFKKHPEMVLGELKSGGRYGSLVVDGKGVNIDKAMQKAIKKLPADIYEARTSNRNTNSVESAQKFLAPNNSREGAFVEKDGKVYRVQQAEMTELPKAAQKKAKEYVGLRDVAKRLLSEQINPATTDEQLAKTRAELNKVYDKFVEQYGPINDKKNIRALSLDPDYGILEAIEDYKVDPLTNEATVSKRAIFTQRTVNPVREVTHADSVNDALTLSMSQTGGVDLDYMSKLMDGKDEGSILKELGDRVYENPATNGIELAEAYLSGNVREKLEIAETAAKTDERFKKNVEALKKVQPKDLEPEDVSVSLGAPWIPASDIQRFAAHLLGNNFYLMDVNYIPAAGTWKVDWGRAKFMKTGVDATQTWGTKYKNVKDLLEAALNQSTPTVTYRDEEGKTHTDKEATIAAQAKLREIQEEFKKWLWTDKERTNRLLSYYNRNFNNWVLRSYDGSALNFPGYSTAEPQLKQHQKDVVWRILQDGTCLMAHCVGAGKTWSMQTAAMELKRLGLANKSMFVIPNHMLQQFENEFRRIYPNAKLLTISSDTLPDVNVAGAAKMSKAKLAERKAEKNAKRQSVLGKIATEDWDGIIISHNIFKRIPMSPEAYNRFYEQQIAEVEQAILDINATEGKSGNAIVKTLEATKKNLEAKLKKNVNEEAKDVVIPFEQLGVDQIFVDEADQFKNLYFTTKMRNIAGMSQANSQRSMDMFMKTQYLMNANNGRGVVFATGTPISNTMAEMFTMLRYLDNKGLQEKNLGFFDNWVATFATRETTAELAPDGSGYRTVDKFTKFNNMPELVKMFRKVADVKKIEDLDLEIPKLKNGKPTVVEIPINSALERYIKETAKERATKIHNRAVDPTEDNMLKLTGDLRKASLDIRLVDPSVPASVAGGKIKAVVEHVADKYKETSAVNGVQLVFCDLSTPKGASDKINESDTAEVKEEAEDNSNITVYAEIKKGLIKKGIPANQIAFIHDAKTKVQKEQLFERCRQGQVRVLIGSTEKMGAGTNIQKKLVAEHHVDAPWRPRDIEQREGRILRQGNDNKEVEIFNYVTKGSFDANMWEKLKNKATMIGQAMSGNLVQRSLEDADATVLSFAEVEALASGNPLMAERVMVNAKLTQMEALAESYRRDQEKNKRILATIPNNIKGAEANAEKAKADIANRKDISGDNFSMVMGRNKTVYTKRTDAKAELERIASHYTNELGGVVAKAGGFDIRFRAIPAGKLFMSNDGKTAYKAAENTVRAEIVGEDTYFCEPTLGSIEHAIMHAPDKALETANRIIASSKEEMKQLEAKVNEPFKYADEYEALKKRSAEIEEELNKSSEQTSNTQYSVSSEAVQRAKEEVEAEIKKALLGAEFEQREDGSYIATMPNGKRLGIVIEEQILLNERQAEKAGEAHNRAAREAEGYWSRWEQLDGKNINGVIRVSRNSRVGTAFHETLHAAMDLCLTDKEKAALYKAFAKKAKESGRSVDEEIADAYKEWAIKRQSGQGSMFGKLFQKAKDFLNKLYTMFVEADNKGNIFRKLESGEAWKQQTYNASEAPKFNITSADIKKFINAALKNPAKHLRMVLGKVSNAEAEAIKKATGMDVQNFTHVWFSEDVRHIKNRHGVGNEKDKRQIGLTQEDIEKAIDVIKSPDRIEKGTTDKGRESIRFMKANSNGEYTVVEVVSNDKKQLAIKTMWNKKEAATTKRHADEISPQYTSETGSGNTASVSDTVSSNSQEVKYSVAPAQHKIANAFTNTERKGTIETAKDFIKEGFKDFRAHWLDKNDNLRKFDEITQMTGEMSLHQNVQNIPATAAGLLKSVCEGDAQSIKAANQHLKNVKMKHNVTLAMALNEINKDVMDKAHPKYLEANGFDSWQNAFGAYLGVERELEMSSIAKAQGETYKFSKGLTEAECRNFVANAPVQFRKAADMFYKVNDNVISIMEDAQVFSHDVAKALRTKHRKYCPLLRDFSDTAAADNFIGGLSAGGRGVGNVSIPLKAISIKGSERGVLNPLETVLKSYAMMINRAERNKVGLLAVKAAQTKQLHDLIKEVPEVVGKDGKVVNAVADPKNCIFTVLVNGKKKAYQTTQELYSPIVGYNLPAAGLTLEVARMTAQMLRTGATMSPSFIIRNLLRDTITAGFSSKNGFIPFVDTWRGFMALKNDPVLRAEFEAAGVGEFNFYGAKAQRIKSLDKMIGEHENLFKRIFGKMEEWSDIAESATRMGEFMLARKAGKSLEQAGHEAREVTVDFSKSGIYGEQINRYIPFFNACLQGGDKIYQLMREDPHGTMMKMFLTIVLPSALLYAFNRDEDWWKDLDPDIKNNYWCLSDKLRIPKPQEIGVLLGSGIEAFFEQASGRDKKAVSNVLDAFLDNMTPSIIPTLILPLVEWKTNYSYFRGQQLVSSKYQRLPDELQYNDYTSELSKGIGNVFKVSPMKVDNLVRGYTGTMGALLWSMAGEPFAKANNLPAKHFSELPFVRDFNVTDANLSRPMNEFYGILDKANRQHAGYGVKGKPEAAVKGIRSAGSMISKIRKDIDKITHSNLSPERKRELIDKRKEKMNQIAKQATARYGKYFE